MRWYEVPRPKPIRLLLIAEAPPAKGENYFYAVSYNDNKHGASRNFFRSIMQGIGLLGKGVKVYSEKLLLDKFLENGYFLIDSCPVPLGNISSPKKISIMSRYTNELLTNIRELKPEKILFVCQTNEVVLNIVGFNPIVKDRLLLEKPLPYPGNGWLFPRKDGQPSFIELFPEEYRLEPIYK